MKGFAAGGAAALKQSAAATLGLLVLAACADEPPRVTNDKHAVQPPGGTWEVTAAQAVEAPAKGASPYLGQRLRLAANEAGDAAGRRCSQPVYSGWNAGLAVVTGLGSEKDGGDQQVAVMEVTCAGQPYGLYAGMPDGSLRTRVNSWLLTLTRQPEPPPMAEMAKPAEPMKMAEPAKMAEPPKATPAIDPRALVYLASYRSEESARRGWTVLTKASPILARQSAILQTVTLKGKGEWVRLYGMAADAGERTAICKQVAKAVDECGSRRRE